MKTFMDRSIYALLILMLVFMQNSYAQNANLEELIKLGKSKLDTAFNKYDSNLFIQAHTIFEQALKSKPSENLAAYYLTYSEYCLLSFELNIRKDFFEKYYDPAITRLKFYLDSKGWESEMRTLLAGIYMLKIAKYPEEAPILFMKINDMLSESKEFSKSNPRTYYISGIMKYRTPAMFGGSINEAIKILKTAVSLYENYDNTDELKPNWGYPETLAWLGKLLMEKKYYDDSEFFLKKALDIRPNYGWVKYVLLPDLAKQKNTK